MKSIRGVLLDVDGTLVDSNDGHARAWVKALSENGFEVPYAEVRRRIGMGGDKLLPEVTGGIESESAQGKKIGDRRKAIFQKEFLPSLRALPKAKELLVRMKAAGLKLAAASSAKKDELGPLLRVCGADEILDGKTSSDDAENSKLDPDIRPQERRFRLDTTSLRGVFNQQIHSSKRSLRSIEDFTEFEQRTAYFNGDQIHAFKKGAVPLDRIRVSHMAQMQNMLNFPPAPKLNLLGRLDGKKATDQELRGEKLFFGKAQCAACHPAPFYLDDKMHDLKLERFTKEPGDGPMKTFTLRGIKDSPPYMHDGRCLTLDDTVEFFNLVLGLNLTAEEKKDLVAFMLCL